MDREKVIKGLEIQLDDLQKYTDADEMLTLTQEQAKEIVALLKEHEETEWEHLWDAPDGTYKGRCKKCGFVHYFIENHDAQYNFCPSCGRSVKRNETRRVYEVCGTGDR